MEEVNIPTKIDCEKYVIRLNKIQSLDDSNTLEIGIHLNDHLVFTNEFLRTIENFNVEQFIKDWVKNKVR